MSTSKVVIKGVVVEVGDIEFFGANKDFPKQRIVVFKPAFRDEYGEERGKPDNFPIDVLGNNVDTLNITEKHLNQKVECDVYFNGQAYKKQDGSQGYAINATLSKITVIEGNTQQKPKEEDDLPF